MRTPFSVFLHAYEIPQFSCSTVETKLSIHPQAITVLKLLGTLWGVTLTMPVWVNSLGKNKDTEDGHPNSLTIRPLRGTTGGFSTAGYNNTWDA